jgi:hypothetical protein
MRTNRLRRLAKSESGCGCSVLAIVLLAAIALFALSQLPEGQQLLKQAVSGSQPPVEISLSEFLVFNGYYVHVRNVSKSTTLRGVRVVYTSASGNSVTQTIGELKPQAIKVLDPSDVRWQVAKHEWVMVSADGFLPKTLETNVLIGQ